ncbi:MAG TPA: iron-containing alcohol dehydrogenase, partial [Candidatus Limnocylindrales bacterium]
MGEFVLGRLPRITFGAGAIAKLPAIVAGHGRRALLVRGGHSLDAGGRLDRLRAGLTATGVELAGEAIAEGEPSPALVDGIAATYRGSGADVVVGVGGGSVLDTAKAVSGLLLVDAPVADFLEGLPGARPWPGPSVPLVAVPTTAGTGSEATRNAVVTERGRAGVARLQRGHVGRRHERKRGSAGGSVRDGELRAERRGQAMDAAEASIREADPREQRGPCHSLPRGRRPRTPRVRMPREEAVTRCAQSGERKRVGEGARSERHVGLQELGHGIHAVRGDPVGRQVGQQVGVDHGVGG